MVHRVKEAFKVYIHRVAVAMPHYLCRFHQRLLRSTVRPESVAPLTKLAFIDGGQHLGYRLLYHTVYHCEYPKLAFLPVVLEYLYPADGVRTIYPTTILSVSSPLCSSR